MIERLVVWGGKNQGLESHRWVHAAFHRNAPKLGIQSTWCGDFPENAHLVTPGSTVISADVYGNHLPFVQGVDYILHNYDSSHPVIQQVAPERLLRLQVWTTDAFGEEWDVCRQYDKWSRILFQPWGTDLLAEEFMEPVFNPQSRDVCFVGAIWGERSEAGELGNESTIQELRDACRDVGLNFVHKTHVSDAEMIETTRSARLAPSFQGQWQVEHGYLACRTFKNPSYGVLALSNNPTFRRIFGSALIDGGSVAELLGNALSLKRSDYLEAVRAQQRTVRRYTFRESFQAFERALEEGR